MRIFSADRHYIAATVLISRYFKTFRDGLSVAMGVPRFSGNFRSYETIVDVCMH